MGDTAEGSVGHAHIVQVKGLYKYLSKVPAQTEGN